MDWKRNSTILAAGVTAILMACGTASPSPSASPAASSAAAKPATSTAPSPSPATSAVPAPSASTKAPSAEEQAYQKAQANWAQVLAAAEKEQQPATIYAVSEPENLARFAENFNKAHPKLQIKFVRAMGPQATERFKAEAATRQYVGNGYTAGSTSARGMASQGLGQLVDDLPSIYEPGAKWLVSPLFDKPHETVTYALTKYFFIVNTGLVPTGQEPKSWKDLTDPKWKDKLVLWDPRLSGAGQSIMSTLYTNPDFGPDVVRKIFENARVVQDNSDPRLVARGDFALAVVTWGNYQSVQDGPVKIITPAEGLVVTQMQAFVAKTAPQVNTTKAYINWLLSKEGQTVLSGTYSAIRPDINAEAKGAQVGDGKLLRNTPSTFEFDTTKLRDVVKTFEQWLGEMGK